MKKIPCLFKRTFEDNQITSIGPELSSPDLQWVLDGEGIATEKYDGSCCAIIDGQFYRRYDAKNGKTPPEGAIPCCDPDPVTGHWPHWVLVIDDDPADKWYVEAKKNTEANFVDPLADKTYEAVGPHFQGNPYGLDQDVLVPHGEETIELPRTFDGIREYLSWRNIEGIVFWKDGEPQCKIKRSDFGFKWPENPPAENDEQDEQ